MPLLVTLVGYPTVRSPLLPPDPIAIQVRGEGARGPAEVNLVLNLVPSDSAAATCAVSVSALRAIGLITGSPGQLSCAHALADQCAHLCSAHAASSARSAACHRIPTSAKPQVTAAIKVIVAMTSMGRSLIARGPSLQCRRSFKAVDTYDFSHRLRHGQCAVPRTA